MRPSARSGFDSLIWRSANCLASNTRSRTLFTENWESWIVDVKKDLPFVDVQFVRYNTTGGEAEQDLADPSRMDPVPDSIAVRGVADKPLDADRCAGTLLGRYARRCPARLLGRVPGTGCSLLVGIGDGRAMLDVGVRVLSM
jgi:hypothetical protein